MVNEQERKQRAAVQAREDRVKEFMTRMEGSVIAEENKKQKLLEDNIIRYEEKRKREDYIDEEMRKKRVMENKQILKDTLRD
jgi:hypothetical protein